MITVHHLETSRSQRILWLLEELGVPYELKIYQRDKATKLAPPELKKIHPLGKSPVITDGDEVIAESGAIIDYIVRRYGNGRLAPPANATPEQVAAGAPWPVDLADDLKGVVLGNYGGQDRGIPNPSVEAMTAASASSIASSTLRAPS